MAMCARLCDRQGLIAIVLVGVLLLSPWQQQPGITGPNRPAVRSMTLALATLSYLRLAAAQSMPLSSEAVSATSAMDATPAAISPIAVAAGNTTQVLNPVNNPTEMMNNTTSWERGTTTGRGAADGSRKHGPTRVGGQYALLPMNSRKRASAATAAPDYVDLGELPKQGDDDEAISVINTLAAWGRIDAVLDEHAVNGLPADAIALYGSAPNGSVSAIVQEAGGSQESSSNVTHISSNITRNQHVAAGITTGRGPGRRGSSRAKGGRRTGPKRTGRGLLLFKGDEPGASQELVASPSTQSAVLPEPLGGSHYGNDTMPDTMVKTLADRVYGIDKNETTDTLAPHAEDPHVAAHAVLGRPAGGKGGHGRGPKNPGHHKRSSVLVASNSLAQGGLNVGTSVDLLQAAALPPVVVVIPYAPIAPTGSRNQGPKTTNSNRGRKKPSARPRSAAQDLSRVQQEIQMQQQLKPDMNVTGSEPNPPFIVESVDSTADSESVPASTLPVEPDAVTAAADD